MSDVVSKEGEVLRRRSKRPKGVNIPGPIEMPPYGYEPPQMDDWRLESRTTWVADGRVWESVIRSKEARYDEPDGGGSK